MTQEYTNPVAQQRMRDGRCPECGGKPDEHSPFREFWLRPPGCDLLPAGVTERVEHYHETTVSLENAAKRLGIDPDTIEPVDIRPFQ